MVFSSITETNVLILLSTRVGRQHSGTTIIIIIIHKWGMRRRSHRVITKASSHLLLVGELLLPSMWSMRVAWPPPDDEGSCLISTKCPITGNSFFAVLRWSSQLAASCFCTPKSCILKGEKGVLFSHFHPQSTEYYQSLYKYLELNCWHFKVSTPISVEEVCEIKQIRHLEFSRHQYLTKCTLYI